MVDHHALLSQGDQAIIDTAEWISTQLGPAEEWKMIAPWAKLDKKTMKTVMTAARNADKGRMLAKISSGFLEPSSELGAH